MPIGMQVVDGADVDQVDVRVGDEVLDGARTS